DCLEWGRCPPERSPPHEDRGPPQRRPYRLPPQKHDSGPLEHLIPRSAVRHTPSNDAERVRAWPGLSPARESAHECHGQGPRICQKAFRACAQGTEAGRHRTSHSGITAGVETGGYGQNDGMNLALTVIVLLMLFIPFVLVGVLFVWGAAKDGQEDRAVQRRPGIRRRTRLGR